MAASSPVVALIADRWTVSQLTESVPQSKGSRAHTLVGTGTAAGRRPIHPLV
jgi:hypothetical protein